MTRTQGGGTASRIAAAAAVATLAFAGALALPALRGAELPSAAVAGLAAQGARHVGAWLVEADLWLLPDQGYRLDVRLTRDVGAPAPDRLRPIVVLAMDGMHRFEPPLALVGPGDFRAEGRLPMPGRWRVSVGFDEGTLDLLVDVPAAGTST